MNIEQIYTGCLAQGAYYITSNGEAAIIDPLREIQPYLDRAQKDGVRIKYIFETHFHADFVSGHLDLHKKTGAPIVFGPTAKADFDYISAKDGQEFWIGALRIKVLHTPGHTLESSCFLLYDELGKEHALFSGDTLFLGDVGRPDLAQKAANMTQYDLAGLLYDSIYTKIMPLPDDLIIYPAHGAGSACGKNMMKETVDSLGNQKKMNYALKQASKESFVKAVTDGLTTPPAYFGMNVTMNKHGYDRFEDVHKKAMHPIVPNDLEAVLDATDALLLDVRDASDFARGFIPRSIHIGLKGDFAPWVGALIVDVKQPIVFVCNPGDENEVITRLSRVGFDRVIGYVDGGFEAWNKTGKEIDTVHRISPDQFAQEFKNKKIEVIDVRKDSEYFSEHIVDSKNKPLSEIANWFNELDASKTYYLHCAGGYRSMIAASILKSRGIHSIKEVEGGFKSISETGVPKTAYVCPSTLA